MYPQLTLHNVASVRVADTGSGVSGAKAYYCRDLIVTDTEGREFCVRLFADAADCLEPQTLALAEAL